MEKERLVVKTALELYSKLLNIYETYYSKLTEAQKKWMKVQNMPEIVPIDFYLDEDKDDLTLATRLEGDGVVKLEPEETILKRVKLNAQKINNGGARLRILTPNKLLINFPMLLSQSKAGNNSYKFKNEIRGILYLLYQQNKITSIKSL